MERIVDARDLSGVLTPSLSPVEQAVLLVTGRTLGRGEEDLGKKLMRSFLFNLSQREGVVKTIVLINSGVLLAIEGSDVVEYLMTLERSGVEVLSCNACLDYYRVREKLMVGTVTNMYNVIDLLANAYKVITV
ncbi:MAG TPA: sulfurtransferase-like selenium metabolism protein YedF [Syntrophothermus lipocalidus]|uniref:sulfurtransferase-like selenium metabolism protein YedF n=1 Tax=Syntrophothermus lipocalidus TaxID=86170 RepID=UPI0002EA30AB|nr:sulfurtransferase-like selenium metabolism protein YedF [Syntrophothermus lipocalidus]HHV76642.1 sulfurtransferase-like selenium metabolism protein YedF [Syntrophothermus lipocalidus]